MSLIIFNDYSKVESTILQFFYNLLRIGLLETFQLDTGCTSSVLGSFLWATRKLTKSVIGRVLQISTIIFQASYDIIEVKF